MYNAKLGNLERLVPVPRRPGPLAVTWSTYKETIGDRSSLFRGLLNFAPINSALYPGSYVDLSPSTAIASVTYVDVDKRAARFFNDQDAVRAELEGTGARDADVRYLSADCTQPLDVADESMDLVISLFAGPFFDHVRRYLKPHGWLLANASHGEASLATLDGTMRLEAVVTQSDGRYKVETQNLDRYLVPRRLEHATRERIVESGKGVRYTTEAFAYLFKA